MWTGKIGYLHPEKNQEQGYEEDYEPKVSAMFFKHIHFLTISALFIQYKRADVYLSRGGEGTS
jgi:hypothetical protein